MLTVLHFGIVLMELKLNKRQRVAWNTLLEPTTHRMLYGGSKGGGKSVFICLFIFYYVYSIIQKLSIEPQKYPIPIAFMGRKRSVDFTQTTLVTWKKFIPSHLYEIKEHKKEIILFDRFKIAYGGLDDEENVQKFQSAEYAIIAIDQAEEISLDDMGMLQGTLRLKVNNTPLPTKVILTANPEICWLKDTFIDYPEAGDIFIPALPADNEFLEADYIPRLMQGWEHRPEKIKQYVDGSWDVMAGDNVVIKPNWVKEAIGKELRTNYKRKVISLDPARYGDDESVFYSLEDGRIIDELVLGDIGTMELAGYCLMWKNRDDAELVVIDITGGLGAGVYDRLVEMLSKNENDQTVLIPLNYSEKASNEIKEQKFINKRAEMYWEAGEIFQKGNVSIPDDPILRSQLSNVQYKVVDSKGKIRIEPKADIKKRMSGKSPDRADALVQGLWALQFIDRQVFDYKRKDESFENPNDSYGWDTHPPIFHEAYANLGQQVGSDYGY